MTVNGLRLAEREQSGSVGRGTRSLCVDSNKRSIRTGSNLHHDQDHGGTLRKSIGIVHKK